VSSTYATAGDNINITPKELKSILDRHAKWLDDGEGGERANLSEANLSGADLSRANLSWTNLSKANLLGADLSKANLSEADLSEANLSEANLSRANLSWTNLSGADLAGANLSGADLSGANLSQANLSEANLSAGDNMNKELIALHAAELADLHAKIGDLLAISATAKEQGWQEAIAALSGKKLVDAGAVVLSVEDAQALDSLLTTFRRGAFLADGFDEHNKLRIAMEQARGKV
jgi:uncharacterized protein YjbI with pentapeptide repeats